MAYYMIQASYTSEAWASMVNNPQDRNEALIPVADALGGSVEGFWLAFGEYDAISIVQLPDDVSAATLSFAINAGGAVKSFKTTLLMTTKEGMNAMKKAGNIGYKPPAG